MKRFLLVFFCSSLAWAGSGDYNVNIHVTATHMLRRPGDAARRQQLDVIIDGKKLELESETIPNALLSLGDYKAKQVKNDHWRGATYDSYEVYEVLLPDKNKTLHCGRAIGIAAPMKPNPSPRSPSPNR